MAAKEPRVVHLLQYGADRVCGCPSLLSSTGEKLLPLRHFHDLMQPLVAPEVANLQNACAVSRQHQRRHSRRPCCPRRRSQRRLQRSPVDRWPVADKNLSFATKTYVCAVDELCRKATQALLTQLQRAEPTPRHKTPASSPSLSMRANSFSKAFA